MVYRFDNLRLMYSTEQLIHPTQWDTDRQRAKTNQPRRERQPYEDINTQLDRYRDALKKAVTLLTRSGETVTLSLLKQELNRLLDKEPKKTVEQAAKPLTFFGFIEQFIQECKDGKRLTKDNKQYSDSTIKDYRKTLNHLIAFQKVYKRRLDYEAYTMVFYDKFKKYLTGQGYTVNTIGALFKNLKILLKQSYRDGLHDNRIFEHEDFKKLQEEVDNIYLNQADLKRIADLDLSQESRLDKVRDAFLIGCYTGLRFSDFSQLKPENISADRKKLTVVTQKTGLKVTIPLHPTVLAILIKYELTPPRVPSNQKFNDYLKELGQLAELTELIQTTRTKGGLRVTRTIKKWELVTSHTARRSFATNAYKSGMNLVDIMKLTGHKTETSFMKYIKVTAEEVADRLADHPFFTGQSQNTERKSVFTKVA